MFRYALTIVLLPSMLYAQHPTHSDAATGSNEADGDDDDRPLGVSMERMGSGTAWIPDACRAARHKMVGSWLLMLHGCWLCALRQAGGRGR